MKKLLSLVLSLLCVVSLSGCAELTQEQTWDVGNTTAPDPSKQQPGGGTCTVLAGYDYGYHRTGLATVLYNYSTLFFTLPEGVDPPVAGDEFTITYTGQMITLESYPSTVMFEDGAITSVSAEPAVIYRVRYIVKDKRLTVLDENGETMAIDFISYPQYYIIDGEGHFAEWSTLTEDTILYGSVSPTDQEYAHVQINFSGMYLENPRP